MADIGKPIRKYRSIPLETDIPADIEPKKIPISVPAAKPAERQPEPVE